MTSYTVCIDPGFVDEALGVVVFREDEGEKEKPIVFSQGFSLVDTTLEKAKRNQNFQIRIIEEVNYVFDKIDAVISKDAGHEQEYDRDEFINVLIEQQIGDRSHGHDLVWLTGVLAGSAHSRGWNVLKMKRNMDCCKRLGIPVSKSVISRDAKKRKTIRKVWELGYTDLKSAHLADAAVLFLS